MNQKMIIKNRAKLKSFILKLFKSFIQIFLGSFWDLNSDLSNVNFPFLDLRGFEMRGSDKSLNCSRIYSDPSESHYLI